MCFRPPEATKNEMKICPNCRKINDTEGDECLYCGAKFKSEVNDLPATPPPPKSPLSTSPAVKPALPKIPKPPGVPQGK